VVFQNVVEVIRGAATTEARGVAKTTVRGVEVVVRGMEASRAKRRGIHGLQTEKKANVQKNREEDEQWKADAQ